MNRAKLTLVGAGPGDPDLISVKGIKALAGADVVLYDALVHPDLLKYVPVRAEKIFVGKKLGFCQLTQDEINKLIVEKAFKYGHVVRLKGGDPFIFGRGHEEVTYAQSFEIKTTVVPGISSSIAVPELQGISLTRRGISESFWVLTGTTKNHELSDDIAIAAKSTATIVILMGVNKLQKIAEIFKKAGRGETPVAVIQNGSLIDEVAAVGDVNNIVDLVRRKNITSPAVIVVGEVVRLHPVFMKEIISSNQIKF